MGDECNVVNRRKEDSASSSSPILDTRIKDLIKEDGFEDGGRLEEGDTSIVVGKSVEPGEETYKISDDKELAESDFSQLDESNSVKDPLLCVSPQVAESTIPSFPYFETKLRPDAPPFLPESLTRSGPAICGIMNLTDRQERSFIPRSMIDDSCFVNIELGSPKIGIEIHSSESPEIMKNSEYDDRPKDFVESFKEPVLKSINVTSTPRLKRSVMKIANSNESFPVNTEERNVVAPESLPNDSNVTDTRTEIVETPIVRGHWRILPTACLISNRIQIVVFVASLLICMILVIYVIV